MQITNSVVCGASKGCIYKQIKPSLVGEHAFPPTGFVCLEAHVTVELDWFLCYSDIKMVGPLILEGASST